jgi:hypothetical protein
MKKKIIFAGIIMYALFIFQSCGTDQNKCTGYGDCDVCSDCSRCEHCNEDEGMCGVCGDGEDTFYEP